ncbi:MAG: ASKHA domain-containing protein [Desulfobacteraceae bacterium]
MEEHAVQGCTARFTVAGPSLENNTADVERLKHSLCKAFGISSILVPFEITRRLPSRLKEWNHDVKAAVFKGYDGWVLVGLKPGTSDAPFFGAAADIGTTRVVLRLVNLETGKAPVENGFDNPQAEAGPDILSRIHYSGNAKGLEKLQTMIIRVVNEQIADLCRQAGAVPDDICIMSAAGNTSMTHLFLGIESAGIIREPYVPCVNSPDLVEARKIGIEISETGQVFMFPNVGSYFGGDLVAGILHSGLDRMERTSIMVDVGTNAEVVVGNSEMMIACAGAAGPALEGGISDIGMTAAPGVIDRVKYDTDTGELSFHTIEDQPAAGICGSGMIDLAAALFLGGFIDIRGKLDQERCGERLVEKDGVNHFILADSADSATEDSILISQVDLDLLTSSKAAMYTILEVIVCNTAALSFEDLDRFFVAGTFGSFIDPKSAISIGMLPDIPVDRFSVLGNSSLYGAEKVLAEPESVDRVARIRNNITYIELNVNQEFMNMFSGAKFYPHTDRSRFPSVSFYS